MDFKLFFLILLALCPCLGLVIPSTPEEELGDIAADSQTPLYRNRFNSDTSPNGGDGKLIAAGQTEGLDTTGSTDDLNIDSANGDLGVVNQIQYLSANNIKEDSSANSQTRDSSTTSPEDLGINSQSGETGTTIQSEASDTNPQPEASEPGFTPPNRDTTVIRIQDDHGVRNVACSTTPDGYAITNGDVIYGTVEDLLSHQVSDDFQPSLSARAFSVRPTNGWPNGIIPYRFDSDSGEQAMKDVVNVAIAHWLANAPYLTFTQVRPNSAKPNGDVLTISTLPCSGCNAVIGHNNDIQIMHLQRSCDRANAGYYGRVDDATHEFGHVLGLEHEHERPDRENHIHFHCENLDPQCAIMPPSLTCCDALSSQSLTRKRSTLVPPACCKTLHDFIPYPFSTSYDYSGPYDFNSIMHYRGDSYALEGKETLVALDPRVRVRVTESVIPTETDFHRVCRIYAKECRAWRGKR